MKKISILLSLAVVLVAAGLATAQGPYRGHHGPMMAPPQAAEPDEMDPRAIGPGMMGYGMMGFGWGAGAWDEAEAQAIQEEYQKFQGDTLKLQQKLLAKRYELKALLADPGSTKSALLAKQGEYNALRGKLDDLRLSFAKDLQAKYPKMGYYYGLMMYHGMGGMMGPGMMGPGMMGPGMMGRGMMGRGMMMGPGMYGPGAYGYPRGENR